MNSKNQSEDIVSNFVNWFASLGNDKPEEIKEEGGKDFISRLINSFSN